MPKSQFDWFTVATLWLGAAIIAVKTGDLPLVEGAPPFLASSLWGYAPFALVSLYGAVSLLRQRSDQPTSPSSTAQASPIGTFFPKEEVTIEPRAPTTDLDPILVPVKVTEAYLELLLSRPTELQLRSFMAPYVGKWFELNLVLLTLSSRKDGSFRAQLEHSTDEESSPSIWAYFDKHWEDHLKFFKRGDLVRFRGKAFMSNDGAPEFESAIPIL